MIYPRQHVRRPLEQSGKLAITLIPFGKLEMIDILADGVDIGAGGLGITAEYALEPGFAVIRAGIGERRDGVLVWSKELKDATFRAGIQFLQTGNKKAEHSELKVQSGHLASLSENPGLVASILVDVIEQS